jgi:hypothetical protein
MEGEGEGVEFHGKEFALVGTEGEEEGGLNQAEGAIISSSWDKNPIQAERCQRPGSARPSLLQPRNSRRSRWEGGREIHARREQQGRESTKP